MPKQKMLLTLGVNGCRVVVVFFGPIIRSKIPSLCHLATLSPPSSASGSRSYLGGKPRSQRAGM
jgi:hypothetical protein